MNGKKAFSLLELLAVIAIIGILSALGWSSLSDLIQTNKAKEVARTLTAFAERAVAESKMRKDPVEISVKTGAMEARLMSASANELLFSQPLSNGFSVVSNGTLPQNCAAIFANNSVTSQIRIGLSGVSNPGCFVACNAGYCGSAVKTASKNTFTAYIKRKNSNSWEEL